MTTLPLHTTTMPKDVYLTLLGALDTDEELYGKTAESINARHWLLAATKAQPHGVPAFVAPQVSVTEKNAGIDEF